MKLQFLIAIAFCSLLWFVASPVHSAKADLSTPGTISSQAPLLRPSTNISGTWRLLGFSGVLVVSAAFSPNYATDQTIFAGTANGIYRSTNKGVSWNQVSPNAYGSLTLSTNFKNDATMFGEDSHGVYRSTDGGIGWSTVVTNTGGRVRIAISPNYTSDGTIFVGLKDPIRISRSQDRGTTWTVVMNLGTNGQIQDIAVSPNYATDRTLFALSQTNVYRSQDGGSTWTSLYSPPNELISLGISPNYAIDQSLAIGDWFANFHRSLNKGSSWQVIGEGRSATRILFSPTYATDQTIFWGTWCNGVHASTDGGTTWFEMNTGLTNSCAQDLKTSPNYSVDHTLLEATYTGLYIFDFNRSGTWTSTNSMSIPRFGFGMVVLDDGRVLVAGGCNTNPCTILTSSEIYDPAAGTWTATGNLNVQRMWFNQIVKLKNGKVLITGGTGISGYSDIASTEIYDPGTGQWTMSGDLNYSRRGINPILLADGRVLAAAGSHGIPDGNRFLSSAEVFSPTLGSWTYTGNLQIAPDGFQTVLLNDGRVMGTGGEWPWYAGNLRTDIYSPTLGTWTLGGDIPTFPYLIKKMNNGKVIGTGGWNGTSYFANANIFDPATNNWTATNPMSVPRNGQMVANLPDGRVLVFGGNNATGDLATSEVYDPIGQTWSSDASLITDRAGSGSIELNDGRVLVCGGVRGSGHSQVLASCEIYNSGAGGPSNPVPTLTTMNVTSATAGSSGFTLVVTGTNFVSGSVVQWNGSARTTTFVNATQLGATINAADIATAGTANVTVFNPTPGGGTSSASTFTINNPTPTMTVLNPSSATAGDPGFTLTVTGTNFVSGSKVRWNGTDRTTGYVSSTQLTATIGAGDVITAGTASVTVFNPSPGGGTSNAQTFTINSSSALKAWTFMLYLPADNNLYTYLNRAVTQLEAQAANPNVNVVVLFDGDRNNDSWRFLVQPGGSYTLGVNKWFMGELNMGNPQTLSDFIGWSRDHYPAEHYYLAIADHGRGTTGVSWDDTNHDYLSVRELQTALNVATNSGQSKIDIIHYDVCLMGMLEDAYQVRPYADYMVASENLGWSVFAYADYARNARPGKVYAPSKPWYAYATVASRVSATTTPRQLALDVANAYFDHPALAGLPRTIAVYDLSQASVVKDAVSNLAGSLRSNLSTWKNFIYNTRTATQKLDSRDYYKITNDDEYVDVYDFARRIKQNISDVGIQNAAQGVMDAMNGGFIVLERHQSGIYNLGGTELYWDLDGTHGASIYFPPVSGQYGYSDYVNNVLFNFTVDSQWDEFMGDLFGVMGLPPGNPIDPGLPFLTPNTKLYLPLVIR